MTLYEIDQCIKELDSRRNKIQDELIDHFGRNYITNRELGINDKITTLENKFMSRKLMPEINVANDKELKILKQRRKMVIDDILEAIATR